MFKEIEPTGAVSFSDQRSSSNQEIPDRQVLINGQVIRGAILDWLRELRDHFPGVKGELKSAEVLRKFNSLPRETRGRVRGGVKVVRIHIVDSLAYQAKENQIYRNILKRDDAYKILLENAKAGNWNAKMALKRMDQNIAHDIIWDSPGERLKRSLRRSSPYGYGYGLFGSPNDYEYEPIDLTPLAKKNASLSGTAAKYASTSGSVFSEAADQIDKFAIFFGNHEAKLRVAHMLNQPHVFDEGDEDTVNLIKDERQRFLVGQRYSETRIAPLYEIDSRFSPHTQAADIAAAFACEAYDKNGIRQIVEDFDYVTLNGEKLTELNVSEKIYYWDHLLEQEKNYQKFLNS